MKWTVSDSVFSVGGLLVVIGAWMLHPAVAVMLAGVGLSGIAVLLGKGAK